jgi:hypothetical protein
MVLSYGWVAGIILGRVSIMGNQYLNQPRYILLYSGTLIALLLMWSDQITLLINNVGWRKWLGIWIPSFGCILLLAIQIPISINAWEIKPYQWAYDAKMAAQIKALAVDPVNATDCLPELPVCHWPLIKRKELTELLSVNKLNVYSPRVQKWHPYLRSLQPVQAK